MGFFKDFKRDFAQAVNELMPDKDELANEFDDEDMVNTFDDNDNMDIAPEDLLEDLDDYTIDDKIAPASKVKEEEEELERPETDYEEEETEEEDNLFDNIPDAEIITEPNEVPIEAVEDEILAQNMMSELLGNDSSEDTELEEEPEDELVELDNLDEKNMLESMEEALGLDGDTETLEEMKNSMLSEELMDVDLNKAVEEALNAQRMELTEDMDETVDEVEEKNESAETEIEPEIESEMEPEIEQAEDDEEDSMAEIKNAEDIENMMKDKEQEVESILTDDTAYITKGTVIKGDIETDGGIDIIGEVQGNVTCSGKLIVGGTVQGNVTAGEIYANAAKIEGEITTEGSVKIGVGSVVMGNIAATSAVVAGAVNGDIDVHGPVIVDSTAVIMGNIKSRSVQINNGAVIEGFCSQCYSEIDVKSFFE